MSEPAENAAILDGWRDSAALVVAAIDGDGQAASAILGSCDTRAVAISLASYAAMITTAFYLGDASQARAMLTAAQQAATGAEAARDGDDPAAP